MRDYPNPCTSYMHINKQRVYELKRKPESERELVMEGISSPSSDNNTLLLVDEFYFSALHDDDKVFPISDEKYAQELQLQEALMSSAIASLSHHIITQPPKIGEGGVEPLVREDDVEPIMKMLKGKEKETGQSSEGFCGICLEVKSTREMFRSSGCSHTFCCDCIGRYVGTKIQENISVVKCPDVKCKGELEPDSCKSIIPKEVFDRWENALCESMFLGSQKVYCPFKDCSAMLVNDGEEVVTVTSCPHCWRMFCAQCKVAWHAGIECGEFQNLNKDERERDDIMVLELAKKNKWRRCPTCKFIVEKNEGCLHITCRCGYEFCYACGKYWRHR